MIVSYYFPPSTNIGGKRWSKLIIYLDKLGYNIILLTSKPKKNIIPKRNCKFYEGVKKVEYFNTFYPDILNQRPRSLIDHIRYKFSLLFLKIFTDNNYYDKTNLIKNHFLKRASKIISQENINTLIISGAPFSLLYYGTILKRNFQLNLVSDLRDPWTWGNGYGMSLLAKNRKLKEYFFENQVLKYSDLITVPVYPMYHHLVESYNIKKDKIKILPHGYDNSDFNKINFNYRRPNKNLKIIYGGTIYANLDHSFNSFYKTIKDNLNSDFTFEFYTNDIKYFSKSEINELQEKVLINKLIPMNEFMKKVYLADFFLLIYPDDVKDFLSSKFYEIIFCKTPIIFVGSSGLVSNFIVENNLGIHIFPTEIESTLGNILKSGLIKNFNYNQNFNVDNFSFLRISNSLHKLLSKL